MSIYKLIWEDFCAWFLEMIKPTYGTPMDAVTYKEVIAILEDNLKILHPFMPHLTEEVWQLISDRTPEDALVIAKYPKTDVYNEKIIKGFDVASEVISGIRTIRKDKNISFKETIDLSVLNNNNTAKDFDAVITKMCNIAELSYVDASLDGALSFRVQSSEYFVPMAGAIDVEAEILKLKEELKYTEGFLKSVQKKLSNERFVNNAPEQVITSERKKEADALAKIETINASLSSLA